MCAFCAVFSANLSARLAAFFVAVCTASELTSASIRSCSENRACQMSIVGISANSTIAAWYAATDVSAAVRLSVGEKPLLRPAMVKLAAMRFTSYSNGPGSVSSKSFRSNTSVRSGDANKPKFERCASPQSWAINPARGVSFRSAAMIFAAPR